MSGVRSALVVRAGALGDTLMVTPLLRALGRRYPEAAIDVVASESAAPLLELNPRVRRVFALRSRNVPYLLSREKRALVGELRDRVYDFAVLLERAPRYRWLVERARVREIRSFVETPFDAAKHAIVNNLRAAGLDAAGADLDMEVFLSEEDERKARSLLAPESRPLVGVHVGYGPGHRKKNQSERLKGWPLQNFVTLARSLAEGGARLVFTGSASDRTDVRRVTTRLPSESVVDIAGSTTVRELAAVIRRLDLLVAVDSGPAHMAAAAGTPLIVLWGPAIYEQVRPLSSKSPVTVVRHPVPCAPCYDTPLMRTCRRNVCMESVSPEEVLSHVRIEV